MIVTQKPATELKDLKKKMKAGYVFIPSNTVEIDGKTVSFQGFFMRKTEVSNMDYKEYLYWLKNNNQLEAYKQALPDTANWSELGKDMTHFSNIYSNHPAYNQFPVVNISREQAEKYCDWLTMIWQENTGNKNIRFRLPLRAEFLAATANATNRPYAWEGDELMDKKGNKRCNFYSVDQKRIKLLNGGKQAELVELEKSTGITDLMAAVKSFQPNSYGLYNLNGNVAEMVHEKDMVVGGDWMSGGYDVRNESFKQVTKASPLVGFRPVMTFLPISFEK